MEARYTIEEMLKAIAHHGSVRKAAISLGISAELISRKFRRLPESDPLRQQYERLRGHSPGNPSVPSCPHIDKPVYARKMCYGCYRKALRQEYPNQKISERRYKAKLAKIKTESQEYKAKLRKFERLKMDLQAERELQKIESE
jgi:hypothetical protein